MTDRRRLPLRQALRRIEGRARAARASVLARTDLGRRANLAQYRYAFSPSQLWSLCTLAEEALRATPPPGTVVEVGVAAGETTVYLHHHLDEVGLARPRYLAVDTFSGFTDDDLDAEVAAGRTDDVGGWFHTNSIGLFRASMALHGLDRTVRPVAADAATFDWASVGPVSFALVDVDLERPVRAALEGLWPQLLPGGAIVVDDCAPGTIWEGALVAYQGFCRAVGVPEDLRDGKLGVLRRAAAAHGAD